MPLFHKESNQDIYKKEKRLNPALSITWIDPLFVSNIAFAISSSLFLHSTSYGPTHVSCQRGRTRSNWSTLEHSWSILGAPLDYWSNMLYS